MATPMLTDANISLTSLSNCNDNALPTATATATTTHTHPRITTSQSEEYRHRLADVTSRASLLDPLNIILQQEKTGEPTPVTPDLLYKAAKGRIDVKVAAGSSVVEAGNFAAVACWEPPEAVPADLPDKHFEEIAKERPVFAKFVRDIQDARLACLGKGQKFWLLSLMARDPERKDKGAVRAVIEPYVAKAKAERLPLWLVAGNPRARDVYAYFGFRVVQNILSYPKDRKGWEEGVSTWCMVCNWPVE